ncbi:response regulator transcription factor [Catalinimonas sp. 4WD22]|uniref:response regulator transcription factor n=1 Tax=Catalinimonas locisalis TaxID=3133978 RepID=UPI0031018D4A
MRILIIEDEQKVAKAVQQGLEEHQISCELAFDGLIGKRLALRNFYDIIILDVIMPGMNGFEVCRELRQAGVNTPVLMLTALDTTDDKLSGFDVGADDYLSKPFEFRELLARIRSIVKRTNGVMQTSNLLRFADLELNLDTQTASRSGRTIELTAKEFALMEYLIRNKGRVLSKAEIADKVWDIHFDTGTNVIEVYVNYLRKKIDKDFPTKLIHTQIGKGYILKEG